MCGRIAERIRTGQKIAEGVVRIASRASVRICTSQHLVQLVISEPGGVSKGIGGRYSVVVGIVGPGERLSGISAKQEG